MPFTISHAAAILPLSRPLARWRLLSATLIGSMVPDFGLFLPWRPPRVETHSAAGLLTFCLPVGLAAYWVFQRLIKTPLMELLPHAAYRRWLPFGGVADFRSVAQWLLAAVGVLAGAVTHLVWDAFTHEGARGVRMIPALDDPALDIAGHHLAGTRLLQDFSSLVGLLLVLAGAAYALRPGMPPGSDRLPRVLAPAERGLWVSAVALAALLSSTAFLLLRHGQWAAAHSGAAALALGAIAALRGTAAALLLVGLALQLRLGELARRPPGPARG